MDSPGSDAASASGRVPLVISLVSGNSRRQHTKLFMASASSVEHVKEVYVEWMASMLKAEYGDYLELLSNEEFSDTRDWYCEAVALRGILPFRKGSRTYLSQSYCLFFDASAWRIIQHDEIWKDAHARGIAKVKAAIPTFA